MKLILGTVLAAGLAVVALGSPASAATGDSTHSVRITSNDPDSVRITTVPDSVRITSNDPDSVRITTVPDSVRITAVVANNREW